MKSCNSHFFLFLFSFLAVSLCSQTTITLTPSEDVAIGFHDGTSSAGNNYGTAIQNAAFWIPSAAAPPPGVNGNRALLKFALSTIPASATITSAFINLYSIPIGIYAGHFGPNNASYLERVTQNWGEFTATWNNQPSSTSVNNVTLPQSTSPTQDYLNINVLNLVLDMINNPTTSFGFKLKLMTESVTNGLLFASKDHSNQNLKPKLVITYITCTENAQIFAASSAFCVGNTAPLYAIGSASSTTSWYASPTSTSVLSTGGVYVPPVFTSPGSYTFYASPTCSTSPRIPVTLTVNPLPTLSITSTKTLICSGQSAALAGTGAMNYTWTENSVALSVGNVVLVTPTVNAVYVLNGVDANGCAGSTSFTLQVSPAPTLMISSTKTLICSGQSAVLTGTGAMNYTWTVNSASVSVSNAMIVTPTLSSVYVLNGLDANGCAGSTSFTLQVAKCQSIPGNSADRTGFDLFPSPAHDNMVVSIYTAEFKQQKVLIKNIQGKTLRSYSLPGNDLNIDVSELSPGVYFCELHGEDKIVAIKKFVVNH